ncbi:MAG: hypothetical protein RMJ35_11005, partial [Phycisphaerales bacterium]|nr:hypothetical protein [Phycisphaerales bacterium]
GGLSDPVRKHVESMMTEIRSLLDRILQADREDALMLEQRKSSIGRQIGRATASRAVGRAYAAVGAPAREANVDVSR